MESALFNVPQIGCYKSDAISVAIGRRLVGVKYLSLVNLILDEPVVAELLQESCTVSEITSQLRQLLENTEKTAQIQAGYGRLHKMLGKGGAAKLVAEKVIALSQG